MSATSNVKNNVSVGKPKIGGAIWRAPVGGAIIPTSATATLGVGFVCMGYVSSDGFKNNNSKEHTEIKAWGGDVVAVPMTNHSDTFTGTFIESSNTEVLKAAHGANNVSGTLENGISVSVNGEDDTEYIYVIDMLLRGATRKRIVIPCGMITEVGEISYKDDDVIGYPLTITGLPDAVENTHYEYIQKTDGTN